MISYPHLYYQLWSVNMCYKMYCLILFWNQIFGTPLCEAVAALINVSLYIMCDWYQYYTINCFNSEGSEVLPSALKILTDSAEISRLVLFACLFAVFIRHYTDICLEGLRKVAKNSSEKPVSRPSRRSSHSIICWISSIRCFNRNSVLYCII
jgi:hypothetical protein